MGTNIKTTVTNSQHDQHRHAQWNCVVVKIRPDQ